MILGYLKWKEQRNVESAGTPNGGLTTPVDDSADSRGNRHQ